VLALAIVLLALPWWWTPTDLGVQWEWAERHLDLARVVVVAAGTLVCGVLLRVLVTGGGPLFGWWGTWVYLAALVALIEVVFAGIPGRGEVGVSALDDVPVALLYAVGGLLILAAFAWRGGLTAWAFGSTLFPDGGRTRLADVEGNLDHVICATDLHAGEHVYFAPRFVYAYRFGLGKPGKLPLRTPVQASAAFPGAFPVRWVPRRFKFNQSGKSEHHKPPFLALVDGGVYDNMGEEWAQGLDDRTGDFRTAGALVVVNASAKMPYGRVWSLWLPLVGGALAFWREKSVLYDSGTAQRRRAMVRQFDLAALGGGGYKGTLVHISQSPYKGARLFEKATGAWAARAARAQEALKWLAEHDTFGEARWTEEATRSPTVPTTLVGFDAKTTSTLVYHGYLLTLINAKVFLGHELPPKPLGDTDIDALVKGA
jgi:hypothetical protein